VGGRGSGRGKTLVRSSLLFAEFFDAKLGRLTGADGAARITAGGLLMRATGAEGVSDGRSGA